MAYANDVDVYEDDDVDDDDDEDDDDDDINLIIINKYLLIYSSTGYSGS